MKIATSKFALFLIVCLCITSCAEESLSVQEPITIFPEPVQISIASLNGSVEDEDGLPLIGAQVTCLNCLPEAEMITDEKGNFQFLNVPFSGNTGFLAVTAEGYFDGYRRLGIVENRINYTRVQLRERQSVGNLSTAEGGTLNHASGARIDLPVNGIIDVNGMQYTGNYEVYMSWIDPSSKDLNMSMMGDLSAIDAENNLVGLATYGMLQVELESPDGISLNLANQSSATLEFPVPASLIENAPVEIPLWSYSEEEGYWIEEGTALLVGDKYVGEVTHFSTWNVDVKIDPVNICGSIGTIARNQEIDLPYFQVELSGDSFQSVGGWLCNDGSFNFINVPSGESLTLRIKDLCGETVGFLDLGPYESGKVNLDPVILDNDFDISFINLSGASTDCNGAPLTNGIVLIDYDLDVISFPTDENGNFNVTIPTCGVFNGSIQIVNNEDFTSSVSIPISNLTENFSLNTVPVCDGEIEEFFHYTIDATDINGNIERIEHFILDPKSIDFAQTLGLFLVSATDITNFFIRFNLLPELEVGDRYDTIFEIILTTNQGVFDANLNYELEITALGDEVRPGLFEFVEGTFTNEPNNSKGSFRVRSI